MRLDEKVEFTREYVRELLSIARAKYSTFNLRDDEVEVLFTLGGESAGCGGYHRKRKQWFVDFNRRLLQENWQDYLDETIAHEVAHVVADYVAWKLQQRDPGHGLLWKAIMYEFKCEPSRCHNYDVSAVSNAKRHARTFTYVCGCREYNLSAGKHMNRKIKTCPLCNEELVIKS